MIQKLIESDWVELFFRWLLGGLFVFAGGIKIWDPLEFADALYNYDLFPIWMINVAVIVIPYLEFVVGTGLLLGIFPQQCSAILMALLVFFLVILTTNSLRGLEHGCGCFGSSDPWPFWMLFLRNFMLFFMAAQVYAHQGIRRFCLYKKGK